MKTIKLAMILMSTLVSLDVFAVWGGSVVSNNEWSSVVGIRGNSNSYCSAVVVHPQLLLTAAHCLEKWDLKNTISLSLSTHDQTKTVKVNISKSKYKSHEKYPAKYADMSTEDMKKYMKYDIGLIKLPTPIDQLLPGVRPAHRLLSAHPQDLRLLSSGSTLTAVGLGCSSKSKMPMIKKYLSVRSNGLSAQGFLSVTPVDTKSSLCTGDSGGGVFAKDRNTDVLVGILSTSAVPFGQGLNSYYVPVKDHLCWAQTKSGIALALDPRTCP